MSHLLQSLSETGVDVLWQGRWCVRAKDFLNSNRKVPSDSAPEVLIESLPAAESVRLACTFVVHHAFGDPSLLWPQITKKSFQIRSFHAVRHCISDPQSLPSCFKSTASLPARGSKCLPLKTASQQNSKHSLRVQAANLEIGLPNPCCSAGISTKVPYAEQQTALDIVTNQKRQFSSHDAETRRMQPRGVCQEKVPTFVLQ